MEELEDTAQRGILCCRASQSNLLQCEGIEILFREVLSLCGYWSRLFTAEIDDSVVRILVLELVGAVESAVRLVEANGDKSWVLQALLKLENREGFPHAPQIVWRYVDMIHRQLRHLVSSQEKRDLLAKLEFKVEADKELLHSFLKEVASADRSHLKNKVRTERSSSSVAIHRLLAPVSKMSMMNALSRKLETTERTFFIDPDTLVLTGVPLGDTNSLVQKGLWLGQSVAVKKCGDEFVYNREAQVFQNFQPSHPNIIQLLGVSEVSETKEKLLVMELKDQDIKMHLQQAQLTTIQAVDIMLQIACAMVYLHSQGICYRDLKLANTMINVQHREVTLIDFGHSKKDLDPQDDNTYPVGTINYMAPEVMSSGDYTLAMDVYSFGIACFEIVSGSPLEVFFMPRQELVELLVRGARPPLPDDCHHKIKQLITQCWDSLPANRPTFAVIYERLWQIKEELLTGRACNESHHPPEVFDRARIGQQERVLDTGQVGITNLTITASNTVGGKATATWQYTNEMSSCVVTWGRYDNFDSEEPQFSGNFVFTTGTSSEYIITPDDLGKHIGMKCLPLLLGSRITIGEQARFTISDPVSRDRAMANEMEKHLKKELVIFSPTVDGQKIQLNLSRSDYYLIWHINSRRNFRGLYARGDVSVEVVGDCSMVISQGKRYTMTFKDSYKRNLAVLLIRHYLEQCM